MRKKYNFLFSFMISFLLFAANTNYAAQEDSLFIKIIGNTVQIWDDNAFANCASKFDLKINFKGSDTIIVTQCDTIGPIANCMCFFDLHVSLTDLPSGEYTVLIYRQKLKIYLYGLDTTKFIGELAFNFQNNSSNTTTVFFEQSNCKPDLVLKTFTSEYWLSEAVNKAKEVNEAAQIRKVYSNDISSDGKSTAWNYKFMWNNSNNGEHGYLYFHNEQDYVTFDSSSTIDDCCIMNISEDWFDSDSALVYAESQGGETFREENPDYTIYASIYQALTPTSYPCWNIIYQSKTDSSKKFSLNFDARKIFTSVETKNNLSNKFQLEQNYPNPFNPTTEIKYSLPFVETNNPGKSGQVASSVQLVIYDVLGNKIATLVNKEQFPGEYSIEFDAGKYGLSSGIYFYQLSVGSFGKANKFIQTKKLILLK